MHQTHYKKWKTHYYKPINSLWCNWITRKNKSEKELSEKIPGALIYSEKTNIRSIPADFASKSPMLILRIIEGPMKSEKAININATGIVGGKRSDGCTYFGQSDNVYLIEQADYVYNDYNFPPEELGVGKRHMVIKFSEASKAYYIKDLSDGTGTFIKIVKPLKLVSNYIISFGDSHMTALIDGGVITIKFLEGIRANEKR